MTTQRVNVYIAGSGNKVFELEQYNPELREWFNVGGVYDKYEHAQIQAENHNLHELQDKLQAIAKTV